MREQDISIAPDYGARYGENLRTAINPYAPGDLAPETAEMRHERMNHDLGGAIRRYRAQPQRMKEGGVVKMKSGGVTRGDGCATRGKTKGKMV
jgi:hypothetical protein